MTKNIFGIKEFGLYQKPLISPFQGFTSYRTFFHWALPNANDITTSWL